MPDGNKHGVFTLWTLIRDCYEDLRNKQCTFGNPSPGDGSTATYTYDGSGTPILIVTHCKNGALRLHQQQNSGGRLDGSQEFRDCSGVLLAQFEYVDGTPNGKYYSRGYAITEEGELSQGLRWGTFHWKANDPT